MYLLLEYDVIFPTKKEESQSTDHRHCNGFRKGLRQRDTSMHCKDFLET